MNSTPDKERKFSVAIDLFSIQTKKYISSFFLLSFLKETKKNVVCRPDTNGKYETWKYAENEWNWENKLYLMIQKIFK